MGGRNLILYKIGFLARACNWRCTYEYLYICICVGIGVQLFTYGIYTWTWICNVYCICRDYICIIYMYLIASLFPEFYQSVKLWQWVLWRPCIRQRRSYMTWQYCWWKKPCITWHVWNLVNNGDYLQHISWCRIFSINISHLKNRNINFKSAKR